MTCTDRNLSLFETQFVPTFLRHLGFQGLYPEKMGDTGAVGYGLSEDENCLYLEIPMPGVRAEDIQVTHDKGVITVKAQNHTKKENRKYYKQASYQYAMSFSLPSALDEAQEPEALYEAGVLYLQFSKKKKYEPKKVTVRSL